MITSRYDSLDLIRQPVKLRIIGLSVLAGLWLNLLPWHGLPVPLVPDFLLLLLLFWGLYQPARVGLGLAFAAGILMDVANATLLGQYALAYVVVVGTSRVFARRILSFGPWRQAVHVFALGLLLEIMIFLGSRQLSAGGLGREDFLPALAGALLWPLMLYGLQQSMRRRSGF